jgi:predicted branched-subunit amino acid permease
VIGRFPGETGWLTLVSAVLALNITHAKHGVRFSQLERRRPRRMRYAGSEPTTDEEVSAAQTDATGNPGRGGFTAAQGRHPDGATRPFVA